MLFKTFLLPLAVSASVLQRDIAETQATNMVIEKLEPQYRKTANRHRYKLGPYTLKGSTTGAGVGDATMQGQAIFYTMPRTLCNSKGPCTILAGKVGVVYADGKDANPSNGIYIHHILTSDSTKKQKNWLSNCGSSTTPAMNIAGLLGGTAFVGAGEDSAEGGAIYTSEDGTRNTGYHVGEKDSFTGWAQLVNYNKEAKQIYVYYDLEWVPGIQGDDVKTATITATCGGSPMIKLGNGPTNTTSGKFSFLEDGKILGARGHLHDGGVKVDLFINDKFICSSDAIYGDRAESGGGMAGGEMASHSHAAPAGAKGSASAAKGKANESSIKTISAMTRCKALPITVKKGDTMKLTAEYDLSKHPLRESAGGKKAADVMGMLGISFTATNK